MIELEWLYANDMRHEQLDSFHGDSNMHVIVLTLKWSINKGSSTIEINHMEWQEIEKKISEITNEHDDFSCASWKKPGQSIAGSI